MKSVTTPSAPNSRPPKRGRRSPGLPSLLSSAVLALSAAHGSALQPGFDQFPAGNVAPSNRAWALAVGDFDEDGFPDFVSGDTAGDVHFYRGDGAGNFAHLGVVINRLFNDAFSLTAGDFNNDGHTDLILARTGGAVLAPDEGVLQLYLGNGNGTFPAAGTSLGSAGTDPLSLTSGDVDGDGDLDFISGERWLATGDTANVILWRSDLAQTGVLSFQMEILIQGTNLATPDPESPPYFPPSAYLHAYGLALGDVTADGLPDLLVSDKAHYLYIYRNTGGGVFAPIRYDAVDTRPFAVGRLDPTTFNEGMPLALADLNADGLPDLATGNAGPGNGAIGLWLNEGLDDAGRPLFSGAGSIGAAGTAARGLAAGSLAPAIDPVPDLVFGNFEGNLFTLFTDLVDTDGDGVIDRRDNAPVDYNPPRIDMNTDGGINHLDQLDNDHDGSGDPADADDDNDGIPDLTDNAPFVANPDQADGDGDGIGDAADPLNNLDGDSDGVTDGPLEAELLTKAMDAKARWSRDDTHFIIRIDALSRVFQNEFVQTFVDAGILDPDEWEAKKLGNYNGIGDDPALPGYNVPADLPGGVDVPISVLTIPKELWNAFGDPDPISWINDRIGNPNLEIAQHGTYHANNTPLGDWAALPDRNFFASESAGLTLEENFQLLRVGRRTLLGEYGADDWILDSGAIPGTSPAIDWSLAANPLISYAPPFNTSDTISRDATARLGYRGFSASIYEEEGALAPFFSPEGSHHESFDPFGMFHASADLQVDPEAPGNMTYLEYLESITQVGGLNTWLIEEVEWSTRYCNELERLADCPGAPGGVNRENNMVDPERWMKWLTLLQYAKDAGVVMTMGDYALAMQFDNAPTVPNPDQADQDHDGVGDAIDGAFITAADVGACVETGSVATLEAVLTNNGNPIAGQLIRFFIHTDGDGVEEEFTGTTDAAGRATAEVVINGALGTTFPYRARWDGGLATAEDEGLVSVVDAGPPVITAISVTPDTLSPINHKLVPVTVTVTASDPCDPSPECRIVSITSNEPETGPGDKTAPDITAISGLTAQLRAERSPRGSGRIYTITVECTDDAGNSSTATTEVTVGRTGKP